MKLHPWKRLLAVFCALLFCLSPLSPYPATAAETNDDTAILAEQREMPIVSIRTDYSITSKETYVDATVSIYDETATAQLTDTAISIRLRGNSTLNAAKKSYRMQFEKKQNLLNIGDGAGKSWNLVSSCYDTSLLRHMTAYTLGNMLDGMPYTPSCRNVEVYLNGQYQGVYLLVEHVNANASRIDIAEDETQVENQGYIVEMTRYAEENYFDIDTQHFEVKSDLSPDTAVADAQMAYISDYVARCYDALEVGDFAAVDALIDVDSLVDIYIASEIVKNVDAGWDSFYCFKDAENVGGKLTFGPMWDFDLALGNFDDVKGFADWAGLNVYDVANINANSNPWFCHAIQHTWFRELVIERWNEMVSQFQELGDWIVEEAESHAGAYQHNCERWNTLGRKSFSEPDAIASLTTHAAHAAYLADWVEQRVQWLGNYFNSADFEAGIFLDEAGNEITEDVNILEYTTNFMQFATDYDYEDTPSCTVRFPQNSWWNLFQLCMTGVMLEEGAAYQVSFDCTATADLTLTWKIQQNYGSYTAYESASTLATDQLIHYETTFTADTTDFNCAFVMEGNGTSGGEVTISNITLRRIQDPLEPVAGDVNGDGRLNIADGVLLQQWLLGLGSLPNWQAGDLWADGCINGLDLAQMRQMLVAE